MSWPCENLGLRTSAHYEDTLPRPGKGSLRSRNKNLAHPAPERIRISGWSGVFTKLEYDPENKTLLFYALVITLRSSSVSFPHFSLILPFISFQFPSTRFQSIVSTLLLLASAKSMRQLRCGSGRAWTVPVLGGRCFRKLLA